MRLALLSLVTMLCIEPSFAQTIELKLENEQPYYRYTATVPEPGRAKGSDATATLELFLSRQGEIANVAMSTPSAECQPVCRRIAGEIRCLTCQRPGVPVTLSIIRTASAGSVTTLSTGAPVVTMTSQSIDLADPAQAGPVETFTFTLGGVPAAQQ